MTEIFYNTVSGRILRSQSSNSKNNSHGSLSHLRSSDDSLGVCEIDSHLSGIVGGEILFKKGIPIKISKNDVVVYELTESEFAKKNDIFENRKKENLLKKFPLTCKRGSSQNFIDRLSSLQTSYPDTSIRLNTGSYFDNSVLPVGWWGCFTDAGGYANMNREITKRLHNFNIIPYIRSYSTIDQVDSKTMDIIRLFSDLSPKKEEHPFVYSYTPMPHEYHRGKKIFFTMMETSTLHPDFVSSCNKYSDEIWVPSKSNREIFSKCGINKKIQVVPLGIDETIYFGTQLEAKKFSGFVSLYGRPAEEGLKSYKFLSVIQWNYRKGYDALIKSFVRSFSSSDDVCLVISTQYSRETVLNDLNQFLPRTSDLPQVVLYNGIVPPQDMPSYYRNFDCYVHLSRGEGFSLTQIEAAACGLPVISCCHSGMADYLTEENSFSVKCEETELCCSRLGSICHFYQGQRMWKVGEKQIDSTCNYMKEVYGNRSLAQKKAELLYSDIYNKFTWEKTATRVCSLLI